MHSHNQILKSIVCFFVVPGNGQALLGMPDTVALNIFNLNIDSLQVEVVSCKTKRKQEAHTFAEGCTNRDTKGVIKQETNGQTGQNQSNKLINYFYSSQKTEADKRESNTMAQKPYQAPPGHIAYA